MVKSVLIANLTAATRERDVDDVFSRFGRIMRIEMRHGGQALVEYERIRDAEDAVYDLSTKGFLLDGQKISVEFAAVDGKAAVARSNGPVLVGANNNGADFVSGGEHLPPPPPPSAQPGDYHHYPRDVVDRPPSVARSGDMSVGSRAGSNRRNRGDRCFICGKSDHWARNCPDAVAQGMEVRSGQCFKCGQSGHLAKFCPRLEDEYRQRPPAHLNLPPISPVYHQQERHDRHHSHHHNRRDNYRHSPPPPPMPDYPHSHHHYDDDLQHHNQQHQYQHQHHVGGPPPHYYPEHDDDYYGHGRRRRSPPGPGGYYGRRRSRSPPMMHHHHHHLPPPPPPPQPPYHHPADIYPPLSVRRGYDDDYPHPPPPHDDRYPPLPPHSRHGPVGYRNSRRSMSPPPHGSHPYHPHPHPHRRHSPPPPISAGVYDSAIMMTNGSANGGASGPRQPSSAETLLYGGEDLGGGRLRSPLPPPINPSAISPQQSSLNYDSWSPRAVGTAAAAAAGSSSNINSINSSSSSSSSSINSSSLNGLSDHKSGTSDLASGAGKR